MIGAPSLATMHSCNSLISGPLCRHAGRDRNPGSDCLAGPNHEAGQAAHGPRVGEIAAQGRPQGLRAFRWLPSLNTCRERLPRANPLPGLAARRITLAFLARSSTKLPSCNVVDSVALQAPSGDARLVRAERPPRGPGRCCWHPARQDGGHPRYGPVAVLVMSAIFQPCD